MVFVEFTVVSLAVASVMAYYDVYISKDYK